MKPIPDGFTRFDDAAEFVNPCPVCGAGEGQCCSEPDPEEPILAVEYSTIVHNERLQP